MIPPKGGEIMLFKDEKVVEVVEVIGADNAKPYLDKGWVVLGVVTYYDTDEGNFRYSLGRIAEF